MIGYVSMSFFHIFPIAQQPKCISKDLKILLKLFQDEFKNIQTHNTKEVLWVNCELFWTVYPANTSEIEIGGVQLTQDHRGMSG